MYLNVWSAVNYQYVMRAQPERSDTINMPATTLVILESPTLPLTGNGTPYRSVLGLRIFSQYIVVRGLTVRTVKFVSKKMNSS